MDIAKTQVQRRLDHRAYKTPLTPVQTQRLRTSLAEARAIHSGMGELTRFQRIIADSIAQKCAKHGKDTRTQEQIAEDCGCSRRTVITAVRRLLEGGHIAVHTSYTIWTDADGKTQKLNDPNVYEPVGGTAALTKYHDPDVKLVALPCNLSFPYSSSTSSPSTPHASGRTENSDRPRRSRASAPPGRSTERRQSPDIAQPSRPKTDSIETGKTKKVAREASKRDFLASPKRLTPSSRLTALAFQAVATLDKKPVPASPTEAIQRASEWRKTHFQSISETEWTRATASGDLWPVVALAETAILCETRTRIPIRHPSKWFSRKVWHWRDYDDPLDIAEQTIQKHAKYQASRLKAAKTAPADAPAPAMPEPGPRPLASPRLKWAALPPGQRTRLYLRYRSALPASATAGSPNDPSDALLSAWQRGNE